MSKRFRALLVVLILSLAGFAIYPTFEWYFIYDDAQRELLSSSRLVLVDEAQKRAQETLQTITNSLSENPEATIDEEYSFILDVAKSNYELDGAEVPETMNVVAILNSFTSEQEAFSAVEQHYFQELDAQKSKKSRLIQLGLDLFGGVRLILSPDETSLTEQFGAAPDNAQISDAVDVAVEVLNSRIDAFGVSEPQIRKNDNNQISVEIPGDNDPDRVQTLLSGKGSLNFVLVDESGTDELILLQRDEPGWNHEVDGDPDFIDANSQVVEYITKDQYGLEQRVRWIAIYRNPEENGLLGQYIVDASTGHDPITGRPTVNFSLNNEGADIFAKLTRDNAGQSLAIVMDDRVRAYAQIRGEIPGGQGSISGFTIEESADIALVLRTAALPVKLNVESQQSIGASISEGAVQAGLRASLLAFVVVVLFMLVYYRGAGFIAGTVLVVNLLMMLAILSAFNLTLTLTSIAAIILTVGMSVDANVIVFERIKEEYAYGKSVRASIDAGFAKALWTVVDANITTFIAVLFLSQVTTGPVQGFAVTLSVGIVTSMVSALFYARLIFDFGCETLVWKKLSIAWGPRKEQT